MFADKYPVLLCTMVLLPSISLENNINLLGCCRYLQDRDYLDPAVFILFLYRTKKTVENCNSFYLDIGLTNIGALGAAHYSLASKALWEFLFI